MFTRGLNFGIDFKGGTKLVVEFGENFDKVEADSIVKEYATDAVTKTVEGTQYEIKSTELDETKTSELFEALKEKYNPDKIGTFKIGSCIGSHSGPGVLGILSFKK